MGTFQNVISLAHAVTEQSLSSKWAWSRASQITRQRAAFTTRADSILANAPRHCRSATLILVEISNLRQINQRHGYATGDHMVDAMLNALAAYVDDADCVARIGGQTFAVLILGTTTPDVVAMTASELREAVDHVLDLQGEYLPPKIRVGATLADNEKLSARALLDIAEQNLALAPEGDGSDVELMLNSQYVLPDDRLERPFANALRDKEFCVYFQPQVSAVTGRVMGAEALVRWHHPVHGWIKPERMVELSEQSGKCLELTRHVFEQSLAFAAVRSTQEEGFSVSINVSPKMLQNPGFLDFLDDSIERDVVNPRLITLEITEQTLVSDMESGNASIKALRDRGFGVAIDDFGKGYSSLAYLREIPATELKVDRMFINRAMASDRDRQLLCMIVDMAHLYGMKAVVEGIEQPDSQAVAIAAGCDSLQGWHVGEPMPAVTFGHWATNWHGWDTTSSADLHAVAWR